MDRIVTRVQQNLPQIAKLLNVAAYARVSTGKDAMKHSLVAQISYYSELIQKHVGWLFCGVYADEALTGEKNSCTFIGAYDGCSAFSWL